MFFPPMIQIIVLASSIFIRTNTTYFWYMDGSEKVYVKNSVTIPLQEVVTVGVE